MKPTECVCVASVCGECLLKSSIQVVNNRVRSWLLLLCLNDVALASNRGPSLPRERESLSLTTVDTSRALCFR